MFLRFVTDITQHMQNTALILNTIILIVTLVTIELYYAERPASDRKQLYYFLPIILVFGGILIYAVYGQVSGGTQ